MRAYLSTILAASFFATSALAADGALSPGKPAGVKQAQMEDNTLVIAVGLGVVAAGIAVAASSGNSHNNTTTVTTTTTSP